MQLTLHIFNHALLPLLVAFVFFRQKVFTVYGIFMLTMLVDLDHLLANPIYEAGRCSINFHPLHSYWAIGCYVILLLPSKTRIPAIGLLMHMGADAVDCYLNSIGGF
jgi:hypothetical protein